MRCDEKRTDAQPFILVELYCPLHHLHIGINAFGSGRIRYDEYK